MNWLTVIQAVAALYLIWLGCLMKTNNGLSSALFKVVPIALAMLLGFGSFAQWRGWPL